jgi:predicted MFS family arabinose efflux permease
MASARRLSLGRYRSCLAVPAFRRLLFGDVISSLGDSMSLVALLWLGIQRAPDGSEGLVVGALAAAYYAPGVALGFLGGQRLAHRSPVNLLAADSALRAAALGLVALLASTDGASIWLVVGILAVASLLRPVGEAAERTLVTTLVPAEQRLAGNALIFGQAQAAMILGPALAGLLIGPLGVGAVIAFDAATFAVFFLVCLTLPGRRSPGGAPLPEKGGFGLAALRPYPGVRLLLVVTFGFFALYGPVEVALPVHVEGQLDGTAATLGLMWTAFGAASVAGAALVGALPAGARMGLVAAIIGGWGLAVLAVGLSSSPMLAIAAMAFGGFVYGPYQALVTTEVQDSADGADLAAVFTAWQSVLMLALPVGVVVAGPLVDGLGSQGALLLSAAGTVALAALVPVAGQRRRGAAPALPGPRPVP